MTYYAKVSAFFTTRGRKARLWNIRTEMDGYVEKSDVRSINAEAEKRSGPDMVYYLLDCISREYSRAVKKIRNKKEKKTKSRFY